MTLTVAPFGSLPDGRVVHRYALESASGVSVQLLTFGGIITSLRVPDRRGDVADIVLGYDTLDGYLDPRTPYFGAIVGRYANRIGRARFTLDGVEYRLAPNLPPNSLHGGVVGFDKVLWKGEPLQSPGTDGVSLRYTSPDGEEGYPGRLAVEVTYRLDAHGSLEVTYRATTDRATPVNLSQHSYFNLAGHAGGDVLEHQLTLHASRYTPVDETLLPTGELATVEGTPFDFRLPRAIGSRIHDPHPQLAIGSGYDHNFVIDRPSESGHDEQVKAAVVHEARSGRTMEISTTEPGVQLYAGNFLDGSLRGKGGHPYGRHAALCLETQHFPDSPNQSQFPSTILRPGEEYRSRTTYAFLAVG